MLFHLLDNDKPMLRIRLWKTPRLIKNVWLINLYATQLPSILLANSCQLHKLLKSISSFSFCSSYTATSKKVALVIGHSGKWNNATIYLSEHQTIASQCPKQPLSNQLYTYFNTLIPEKTGSCTEVRLNSPRGKLKITNMADDQVDLTPEDIPGTSFIEEEIEKLPVAQLKFWLKCRRRNQSVNKKELLER